MYKGLPRGQEPSFSCECGNNKCLYDRYCWDCQHNADAREYAEKATANIGGGFVLATQD